MGGRRSLRRFVQPECNSSRERGRGIRRSGGLRMSGGVDSKAVDDGVEPVVKGAADGAEEKKEVGWVKKLGK